MYRPLTTAVLLLAVGCDPALPDDATRRSGGGDDPRLIDDGASSGDVDAGEPSPPPPARDAGGGPPPERDAGPPPPDPDPDAGPSAAELTAAERDLLDAINRERTDNGLHAVEIDERLLCAARRHAMDVGSSGSCGHVGSDGSWPWDRAEACGFPQDDWTVNEIAAGPGFSDGEDAVWGWRASSGHYAALMHERASFVGVGVHETCFIALFDCCVAGSE